MVRSSTSVSVLSVMALLLFAVLFTLAPSVKAESLGSWTATSSYPVSVAGNACASSGGYVYCVGGYTSGAPIDSVYYATLSSSGVGTWTSTTDYPTAAYLPSCAISGGYIYCVGGLVSQTTGTETSSVYYASISSSGVGTWTSTTSYPTDLEAGSCGISGGYIYCVAGLTGIGVNTNAVYYAPISSSGVGTWTSTTVYPTDIEGESCTVSGGYITCVAGQYDATVSGDVTNDVYYATLSSSGVGTWTSTTDYPSITSFTSCENWVGYIYCVGGYAVSTGFAVYYAPLSSGVVGAWTSTTSYPDFVQTAQCVMSGGYIYCNGGFTSDTFYALISSTSTSTSIPTTTTTLTTTVTQTLPSTSTVSTTSFITTTTTGVCDPVSTSGRLAAAGPTTTVTSTSTSTVTSTVTSVTTVTSTIYSTVTESTCTTQSSSTTTTSTTIPSVPEFALGGTSVLLVVAILLPIILMIASKRRTNSSNQ